MKTRKPLLIANRGEIAIRIARSAKALGFPVVGVYSDADKNSEHIQHCDIAIGIGGVTSKESYLQIPKIIEAAKKNGAQFIHPGYGFLSERPEFVEACEKAGITFVGPTAASMHSMGDKITARKTATDAGVMGVPGSPGALKDIGEVIAFAKKIGFPILLKAAAGGGGKGMRRVDKEDELASAFEGASREALNSFNDASVYIEKYVLKPHHVEIQVFGDGKGGGVHLGERECSIQRRHQKVWEETPAPILERFPKTREAMFEAALRLVKHVKYAGAGTLEFIVDEEGGFYFLEMNTRLQVEHPVTEWVTGVDLVAWQLQLAAGEWKQPEIPVREGSSIEVRLYAEDPETFLPAPGKIGEIRLPSGTFVRVDSAFTRAGEVSVNYDPMISKISVWAPTRLQAIDRMRIALSETAVYPAALRNGAPDGSLKTNLHFLKKLVNDEKVIKGDTSTDLIPSSPELTKFESKQADLDALVAAALFQMSTESKASAAVGGVMIPKSVWMENARRESVRND